MQFYAGSAEECMIQYNDHEAAARQIQMNDNNVIVVSSGMPLTKITHPDSIFLSEWQLCGNILILHCFVYKNS